MKEILIEVVTSEHNQKNMLIVSAAFLLKGLATLSSFLALIMPIVTFIGGIAWAAFNVLKLWREWKNKAEDE